MKKYFKGLVVNSVVVCSLVGCGLENKAVIKDSGTSIEKQSEVHDTLAESSEEVSVVPSEEELPVFEYFEYDYEDNICDSASAMLEQGSLDNLVLTVEGKDIALNEGIQAFLDAGFVFADRDTDITEEEASEKFNSQGNSVTEDGHLKLMIDTELAYTYANGDRLQFCFKVSKTGFDDSFINSVSWKEVPIEKLYGYDDDLKYVPWSLTFNGTTVVTSGVEYHEAVQTVGEDAVRWCNNGRGSAVGFWYSEELGSVDEDRVCNLELDFKDGVLYKFGYDVTRL